MRLKQLMCMASKHADKVFGEYGGIPMMVLAKTPLDVELWVVPGFPAGADQKEMLAKFLRETLREREASLYVLMMETWTVDAVRPSADLPDDEGTVFIAVAGQNAAYGRRCERTGQLYVGGTGTLRAGDNFDDRPRGVELVTGQEADELLSRIKHHDLPPSQNPHRKEAVLLDGHNGTEGLMGMREIVRPDGKKPFLTRLKIEGKGMKGRFSELLSKSTVH